MRAQLAVLTSDVVFDGPIFAVGNDGFGCYPSVNLVLINQAHKLTSFIHYSGGGLERGDNSLGVIDHSVVLVSRPSSESLLTRQGCFRISAALKLFVRCLGRVWSG